MLTRRIVILAVTTVVILLTFGGYLVYVGMSEGPCTFDGDDPEGTRVLKTMDWSWSEFGWECVKIYPDGTEDRFFYFI
jgi:hypothetical protein